MPWKGSAPENSRPKVVITVFVIRKKVYPSQTCDAGTRHFAHTARLRLGTPFACARGPMSLPKQRQDDAEADAFGPTIDSLKRGVLVAGPRPESPRQATLSVDNRGECALQAFGTETGVPADLEGGHKSENVTAAPRTLRLAPKWLAVVLLSGAAAAGGMSAFARRPVAVVPGSLTLNTVPSGLEVAIAGQRAGVTPLTLSLAPGDHRVVIFNTAGQQREVAVTLKPGETVVQHLEMSVPATPVVATTGALRVQTEPPQQSVMIDGIDRGMSPLTVTSMSVGDHVVVVRGGQGVVRRNVSVEAGETVSLVISSAASSAVSAGWLTVASPVALQLREDGKLIGTTETDRLLIAAGEHQIEMSNDALGFRTDRRVTIQSGKTFATRVEIPNGTVSINAVPWAEVWLDGERIGETPIANLSRPIGVHEVILRHPEFGERKTSLTVSLKQTARLGVDMRKP